MQKEWIADGDGDVGCWMSCSLSSLRRHCISGNSQTMFRSVAWRSPIVNRRVSPLNLVLSSWFPRQSTVQFNLQQSIYCCRRYVCLFICLLLETGTRLDDGSNPLVANKIFWGLNSVAEVYQMLRRVYSGCVSLKARQL